MSKDKDIFPVRKLVVHDKKAFVPEKVVIQHDMSDFIRELFKLDREEDKQPCKVIPLKRDGQ